MHYMDIVQRLAAAGFHTAIVGGFNRNTLLGVEVKDVDIATFAKPDQIKEIFKDETVQLVGEKFGVCIVAGHEVATFRKEGVYTDKRRPDEVTFGAMGEDACRRDFTINCIYRSFVGTTSDIYDPFNGVSDCRNKILRTCGAPFDRFNEDPLRILRGIRLAIIYGLTIEPETEKVMLSLLRDNVLRHVSRERIWQEVIKIEQANTNENNFTSEFFTYLEMHDILDKVFPGCHKHYNAFARIKNRKMTSFEMWLSLIQGDKNSLRDWRVPTQIIKEVKRLALVASVWNKLKPCDYRGWRRVYWACDGCNTFHTFMDFLESCGEDLPCHQDLEDCGEGYFKQRLGDLFIDPEWLAREFEGRQIGLILSHALEAYLDRSLDYAKAGEITRMARNGSLHDLRSTWIWQNVIR